MISIASVGSIVVDLAVSTPRVPLTGENFVAHSLHIGPGGKGANAAAAIAKLGAHSLLVGKVGDDDFGRLELNALKKEGVDISSVGIDSDAQTSTAVILINDRSENTILVIMGANDQVSAGFIEQALTPHAATLNAIIVDFEIPESAVAATVRFGKRYNIPVIVDAGPPRQFDPLTWRDATVLSPNEHEAAAMVGYPVDTDEAALRAARELLAQGPQAVVLKRGAAGALLMTADETFSLPVFPVVARDTTGAGDAFTAMFTVAMIEGKPLREAIRWGNAAGALATTRIGTMPALPSRNEVEQFLTSRS